MAISTYQQRKPLIEMLPGLRAKRLGEIELGRLVLLGNSADGTAIAGIAIRADALSRAGDITEGVVRLGGGAPRFERHALDDTLVAIEVEYLLEPDLASASARPARTGDLVVSPASGAVGVVITGPWQGFGLMDVASAVARPFAQAKPDGVQVMLAWRLVELEARSKILFVHQASAPRREPLPRDVSERPDDEVPHYARDRQNRGVPGYTADEDD
jgi:hypothetical protein